MGRYSYLVCDSCKSITHVATDGTEMGSTESTLALHKSGLAGLHCLRYLGDEDVRDLEGYKYHSFIPNGIRK